MNEDHRPGMKREMLSPSYLLTISTPQIVVAKHDDWRDAQFRSEHTFTGGIEAVAVD